MLQEKRPNHEIDQFLNMHYSNAILPQSSYRLSLYPGGGGALGCYSRLKGARQGHFEVTKLALNSINSGLNKTAILSIARASRLPDLLHFNDLEFHCMTELDKNKIPIDRNQSIMKCKTLFQNTIFKAIMAINQLRFKDFFFEIGIFFHIVQDLVIHRGMTNVEHIYLDNIGSSPDLNTSAINFAVRLSKDYYNLFFLNIVKKIVNQLNQENEVLWGEYNTISNFAGIMFSDLSDDVSNFDPKNSNNISRWLKFNNNTQYSFVKKDVDTILQ